MGTIAWIILGLAAGLIANVLIRARGRGLSPRWPGDTGVDTGSGRAVSAMAAGHLMAR
jgi:hypothetical protein